jgi:hypothetical protein
MTITEVGISMDVKLLQLYNKPSGISVIAGGSLMEVKLLQP